MNHAPSAFDFFHRLRPVAAGLVGMLGLVLLWTGFGVSDILALQREAVAETSPADPRNPPLTLVSRERAVLLQSTVDSVALSLGSMLASSPAAFSSEEHALPAVAAALSSLTFGLGGEVYFTVWDGTRMMHAPLAPDAEGMDFAEALDGRGAAFVLAMQSVAAAEGGFIQAALPRQFSDGRADPPPGGAKTQPQAVHDLDLLVGEVVQLARQETELTTIGRGGVQGPVADVTAESAEVIRTTPTYCPISNHFSAPCASPPAPVLPVIDQTPVEQVVYVRLIPRTRWHIAAFMPVEQRPARGFSEAWSLAAAPAVDGPLADYRRGLCVSGFSLAGLAGLMLVPGRRERDLDLPSEPPSDPSA